MGERKEDKPIAEFDQAMEKIRKAFDANELGALVYHLLITTQNVLKLTTVNGVEADQEAAAIECIARSLHEKGYLTEEDGDFS